MAWRDRLRQASYKNRQFYVSQSTASFGRRTVLHEFPGRDIPYNEDLGRRTRELSFDAYVIGPNHDIDALELKTAFETEGSGELVHPFLGTYYGTASVEIRQSFQSDLGITYLNISFTEDGNNDYSDTVINPSRLLSRRAFSLRDAGIDRFIQIMAGVTLASSLLRLLSTSLSNSFKSYSRVNRRLSQVNFEELVSEPRNVAVSVSDAFFSIAESNTPREAFDAILLQSSVISAQGLKNKTVSNGGSNGSSIDNGSADINGSFDIPQQRDIVFNAVAELVKTQAVAAAAQSASRATWGSYQSAIESRSRFIAEVDKIAENSNDEVYQELRETIKAINMVLPGDENSPVNLVTYTPGETLPALVLSYRLYGDETKDSEIVDQNNVENPNFIVGGKELLVRVNDNAE